MMAASIKKISRSEAETQSQASEISALLEGGETLALMGDLGAGKTAFTKGLAKALGIKKPVTSPTFVLMKVYPLRHATLKRLVHIDAYRLSSGESLKAIGLLDYMGDPETVVVIEWADRVKDILPKNAWQIRFSHGKADERTLEFKGLPKLRK